MCIDLVDQCRQSELAVRCAADVAGYVRSRRYETKSNDFSPNLPFIEKRIAFSVIIPATVTSPRTIPCRIPRLIVRQPYDDRHRCVAQTRTLFGSVAGGCREQVRLCERVGGWLLAAQAADRGLQTRRFVLFSLCFFCIVFRCSN